MASYYPWIGEASPENARAALAAAEAAQRIVDTAAELNLASRFMDLEIFRMGQHKHEADGRALDPKVAQLLARFPRDGLHSTLDFLETDQGLLLLEGGPRTCPTAPRIPAPSLATRPAPRPGSSASARAWPSG